MNILIIYGSHEAPAIQDIYFNNPLKILEKRGGITFNLVEFKNLSWNEIYEYHLVIIVRIFEKEVLSFMDLCKKAHKDVFFFFDDDILDFPTEYYLNHEPFYKNNEQLIIDILVKASGLIVSTENLKVTYEKYNATIHVTPPCLDVNFVKENTKPKTPNQSKKQFTIGYAGSFGHVIDFRFLEKALLDFYKKYHPFVNIEFMGCIPDAFGGMVNNDSIKLIHWKPSYEEYLKNLFRANWDIALCPVLESSYTSHKTNVKYLEYSAARIPGIFSDINIYNKDIVDGKNGFLAKNDYKYWIEALENAYKNRNKLKDISEQAYDYVVENFSAEKSAERWLSILQPYEKKGLSKLIDFIIIKLYKVKRIFLSNGVAGITAKISQLYNRKLFNNQKKRLLHETYPVNNSFSSLLDESTTKNFDKKIIKKQVLFIIPWLSVGGGDMVNLIIADNLDKEKYTLHFITTENSKHEWEDKFKKISKNIFHIRKVIPQAKDFWEYNHLILEYIKIARIDIVIISNSAIGYTSVPSIKEKFGTKIIDILHGQGGSREGGGFPEFSKSYDPFINVRITINRYLKEYIINKYQVKQGKIQVIPNSIDTAKFNRPLPKSRKTFVVSYVGRLTYEKHPEKVIDIAEKVLKSIPDAKIRFQIIGDGPMHQDLKSKIHEKGLEGIVKMKGYKNNIKKELETTDALILCSEMEGLPIVLLEAMSMQVPCIASNVGGIPELIDDGVNGYLVNYGPEMADVYASKIVLLYKNEEEWNNIAQNAREKVVKHYSLTTMISAYEKLLN